MGWRHFLNRKRADLDHAQEFQSHVEIEVDNNIALGMPPEDARRAAHLKFGNPTLIREEVYHMNVDILLQDARFGLRQLRRTPVTSAIAVLTLALGIGANTAIFSAMNALMLRLLPLPDPQRLVYLATTNSIGNQTGDGDTSLTEFIFEQMRTQRTVFSDVVAFAPVHSHKVAVRYGAEPEVAWVDMVSGDFFSGLGVMPLAGRTFTMEDETSHAPLAVLSYEYWTRRFGRDHFVLGQTLYVKGVPLTIVGVASPGFIGVEHRRPSDIWIPLQNRPELKPWGQAADDALSLYGSSTDWWCLKVMGRLAPGVSEQQALAQLNPVFQRAAYTGTSGPAPHEEQARLYFSPARGIEGMRDAFERPLQVLMVMVGVVLLIACGNIAMLLAARNAARQREFSLRMALGGSRWRLFRQLLTESLLLVVTGGALGWLFTAWATRVLAVWADVDVSLAPDRKVQLFTMAVMVGVALLFGLAPLRSVVRIPIGLALKTSSATANQDKSKLRSGQVLVALQISLCLMLLVGAGLLLRTLRNLETANLGIRAPGLLVFGLSPQNVHSDADAVRFHQTVLDRMRGLPGVESATLMRSRIGAGGSWNTNVVLDGARSREAGLAIRWNAVGPNFFHVLGTPVLLGRDFTDADSAAAPKVAIIDETFAKRYLANREPVGHRITMSGGRGSEYTIIGVVANSKYTGVRDNGKPTAYIPYTQVRGVSAMHFDLRTSGNPATLLLEVRRAVRELAPDLPLLEPMTQQEQFESSFALGRLVARLSVFFAMLAALLVATGLYGTLAYTVSRRTTEVGVRMALGAQRGEVLWMILRQSLGVSLVGLAIGIPLSIAGTRLVSSMLYGVTPGDPLTFLAAFAGITVVAIAASLIPARRAASVDPIMALRYE